MGDGDVVVFVAVNMYINNFNAHFLHLSRKKTREKQRHRELLLILIIERYIATFNNTMHIDQHIRSDHTRDSVSIR